VYKYLFDRFLALKKQRKKLYRLSIKEDYTKNVKKLENLKIYEIVVNIHVINQLLTIKAYNKLRHIFL